MEKTDCRELLEVNGNVIDVKSIAFLMILLASEVSFVTLHMRWHEGCCCNSIHKNRDCHGCETAGTACIFETIDALRAAR